MPAPAAYNQTSDGGWIRKSDASGPYTVDCGQGTHGPFHQNPTSGFWVAGDGSGPYFRDVTAGTVTAVYQIGT